MLNKLFYSTNLISNTQIKKARVNRVRGFTLLPMVYHAQKATSKSLPVARIFPE